MNWAIVLVAAIGALILFVMAMRSGYGDGP